MSALICVLSFGGVFLLCAFGGMGLLLPLIPSAAAAVAAYFLQKRISLRQGFLIPFCCGLLSLSLAVGAMLDKPVTLADGWLKFTLTALFMGACLLPLTVYGVSLLLAGLKRLGRRERASKFDRLKPGAQFGIILAVILIAWLPVYLAYYPGLWNYDPWQVKQVATGEYSANHPLIHTLLLGNCYKLGYLLTGEGNLGVMIYDGIQSLILASALSYACLFIRMRSASRLIRTGTLLFFMFFPVNPIMAISSTKDVIFSALVLAEMLMLIDYLDALRSDGKKLWKREIGIILVSAVMMLFRNNAVCGFIATLILIGIMALRRRNGYLRRCIAVMLAALILFGGCNVGLSKALNARSGAIKELLSVPAAQFGRVYFTDTHESAAKDEMSEYYNLKGIVYKSAIADQMKKYIVEPEGSGKLGYIRAWINLVKEYPEVCIDAFLYLNKGSWHIGDHSFAEVYGTEGRQGYMQTCVMNGYKITHTSYLPFLESLFEKLFTENAYQKVPVLDLLCAPALYFWILLLGTALLLKKGKKEYAAVLAFLLAHHMTMMLGPCTLVRYMYPYMLVSPAVIALLAEKRA